MYNLFRLCIGHGTIFFQRKSYFLHEQWSIVKKIQDYQEKDKYLSTYLVHIYKIILMKSVTVIYRI